MSNADNMVWRKSGTQTTGTSAAFIRQTDTTNVAVGVYPTSGTANVQITLSHPDLIEAGTAKWIDWASGAVATNTIDSIDSPITAIRIVVAGGSADYDIVGD